MKASANQDAKLSFMPMFPPDNKNAIVKEAPNAANGMLEGNCAKLISTLTKGPNTPELCQ
jgi:hypothetical protein